MRVLFLDIDGVLNSAEYWGRRTREQRRYDERSGVMGGLDPRAVTRLNGLLKRTGAKICVSSTVRLSYPEPEALYAQLRYYGVEAEFVGVTPRLLRDLKDRDGNHVGYSQVRGHEIDAWLREHPEVARFAIVDDGSDMDPHMARLVQTSFEDGLLNHHCDALEMLLTEEDE